MESSGQVGLSKEESSKLLLVQKILEKYFWVNQRVFLLVMARNGAETNVEEWKKNSRQTFGTLKVS